MRELENSFLQLVRLGIGTSKDAKNSKDINWSDIQDLAYRHGLLAIVVDGIEKLPSASRPPQELLLEWIGEVLQDYEYRYEQYEKTIAELASFYNCHGFKMMILKGYACSLDWPKPEHRPCGDIDIWLFGRQKEADDALLKANTDRTDRTNNFSIDTSHHHHTVFNWGEFTVENHYDFVNVHAHRSSAELEKIFKDLGQDNTNDVEVYGEKVYLPFSNLHALFLIKHMVSHFAAADISLRQVLDWGFFVEKHHNEIDWGWLQGMLDKYHMKVFVNCINAICIEDLGFAAGLFPSIRNLPNDKEKVLVDILEPAFTSAEPNGFFSRIIYKYKRWQGNAWKQKMCYGESRWEMFWTGIWAKIIKPSTI